MINVLLLFFIVFYGVIFIYSIYRNYIKPRLEKETYLNYSPFNIVRDNEGKHEDELFFLYSNIKYNIKQLLLKNKNLMGGTNNKYSVNNHNLNNINLNNINIKQQEFTNYLQNYIKYLENYITKFDNKTPLDKKTIDGINGIIDSLKVLIKKEKKEEHHFSNNIIKNIIIYILGDAKLQLKFLEKNNNTKTKTNIILNLINVAYIERKVNEIMVYNINDNIKKNIKYINLKIREYIKIMNTSNLMNNLISKKEKDNPQPRNNIKIMIIKEKLYDENNKKGHIYKYLNDNFKNTIHTIQGIKKLYKDPLKIKEVFEPYIPTNELKSILNKIINTQFIKNIPSITFEDSEYENININLTRNIINENIITKINHILNNVEIKPYMVKHNRDDDGNIISSHKIHEEEEELSDMFKQTFNKEYKLLNYEIMSLNESKNKLFYNNKNNQIETNKTNIPINICYNVIVNIYLNKVYTNDIYKVNIDMVVFENNLDKTNDKKVIEEIINNKMFHIKKFHIESTYYDELYVTNSSAEYKHTPYIKHHNSKKHHHSKNIIDDFTHDKHKDNAEYNKYVYDKDVINKLLCRKKAQSNQLLHNYVLLNDKFTHFKN